MANLSVTFINVMVERLNMHDILLKQYREFDGEKFFGTYWPISAKPILTIRDLNLVQHVLSEWNYLILAKKTIYLGTITVSDFDHFTDRSFGGQLWDKGTSKRDIMWQNALFTIKGGKNHRLVRQTLTPAFTSSKLKMMLEGCSLLLLPAVDTIIAGRPLKPVSPTVHDVGFPPC